MAKKIQKKAIGGNIEGELQEDPIKKKPFVAPANATKVNAPGEGFIFAGKQGNRTYYDIQAKEPSVNSLPGKSTPPDKEKLINHWIEQVKKGVNPNTIIGKHLDPSYLPLLQKNYKAVYTEEQPTDTTVSPKIELGTEDRIARRRTDSKFDKEGNVVEYVYPHVDSGYSNPNNITKRYFYKSKGPDGELIEKEIDPDLSKTIKSNGTFPSYLETPAPGVEGTLKQPRGLITDTTNVPKVNSVVPNVITSKRGFKKGGAVKGYDVGGNVSNDPNNTNPFLNQSYLNRLNSQLGTPQQNGGTGIGGTQQQQQNTPVQNTATPTQETTTPVNQSARGIASKLGQTGLYGLVGNTAGTVAENLINNQKKGPSVSGEMAGDALRDAGTGAQIGSMFGPVGTAIGAGAGLLEGGIRGYLQGKKKVAQNKTATSQDIVQNAISNQYTNPQQQQQNYKSQYYNPNDYTKSLGIQGFVNGGKVDGKYIATSFANGGKVKGGQIEGAGTGKSDSITAKVKEDSFVVPEENSGLAKILREQYLNKDPNAKANLYQKGGEGVKLSNGEHLFTPEETLQLFHNGVDVSKLAPNADGQSGLKQYLHGGLMACKDGGLTSGKAKEILHDKSANGHALTDKQRRYMDWVAGGKKAEGGMVDGDDTGLRKALMANFYKEDKPKEIKTIDGNPKIIIQNMQQQLNKKGAGLKVDGVIGPKTRAAIKEKGIGDRDGYADGGNIENNELGDDEDLLKAAEAKKKAISERNKSIGNFQSKNAADAKARQYYHNFVTAEADFKRVLAKKDATSNEIEQAKTEYNKHRNGLFTNLSEYQKQGGDVATWNKGVLPPSLQEQTKSFYLKNNPSAIKKPVTKNKLPIFTPPVTTGGGAKPTSGLATLLNKVKFTPSDTDRMSFGDDNVVIPGTKQNNPVAEAVNPFYQRPTDLPKDFDAMKGYNTYTPYSGENKNKDTNNQYGLEAGLAALQAGVGINYLNKSKRPVDQVDPLFQNQVNQSIKNASYGYTPEQKGLLDQQSIENRNLALSNVYNAAGGNGSVALGNARAVFNDAYKNRLANASEDEMLRMQKQGQANQMSSTHQDKLRQLFSDRMQQFQQQQQSGAALLGSGIRNFISAGRYRQEQQANDQIQQIDNQYLNGI